MKRLSVPQIVLMHNALIKETGGMDGIRDVNLLEAKAARLGYSIVKNHPLQTAIKESECWP